MPRPARSYDYDYGYILSTFRMRILGNVLYDDDGIRVLGALDPGATGETIMEGADPPTYGPFVIGVKSATALLDTVKIPYIGGERVPFDRLYVANIDLAYSRYSPPASVTERLARVYVQNDSAQWVSDNTVGVTATGTIGRMSLFLENFLPNRWYEVRAGVRYNDNKVAVGALRIYGYG